MYGHAHVRIRSFSYRFLWIVVCGFGRAHPHLLLIGLHCVERKRKALSKKQAAQYKMTTKSTDDLTQKRKCPEVNPMQAH